MSVDSWAGGGPVIVGRYTGCSPHHAYYSVQLDEILEPSNAVEIYSPVEIGSSKVACGNDLFWTSWSFDWTSVDLRLENRTDQTLRFIWDEGVFVDADGDCYHLVTSAVGSFQSVFGPIKPAKSAQRMQHTHPACSKR